MRTAFIANSTSLAAVAVLLVCRSDSNPAAPRLQEMSFANSEWSEPVDLGPVVNSSSKVGTALTSAFDDVTPSLSWDGRTLSFASNRPGGSGGNDLYMSTRTPSGQE